MSLTGNIFLVELTIGQDILRYSTLDQIFYIDNQKYYPGISIENLLSQGDGQNTKTEVKILLLKILENYTNLLDSTLEIFSFDFIHPKYKRMIFSGSIKNVTLLQNNVELTVKSPIEQLLNTNIGTFFSPTCRAEFCDKYCGINAQNYTFQYKIIDIIDTQNILCNIEDKENNYFNGGTALFINNIGFEYKIRILNQIGQRIALLFPLNEDINIGDNVKLTAGCNKTMKDCKTRFNNIQNFRGEMEINNK